MTRLLPRLRLPLALTAAVALLSGTPSPTRAQDASAGFAAIEPSLVRVWAFNAAHVPVQFGTGIVVGSDEKRSLILTAGHVVANAASHAVQAYRNPESSATLEARGSNGQDLALLSVPVGGLKPATFASRTRQAAVGYRVAVAGFVEKDDRVADARLRVGDVSSLPRTER